MRGSGKGTQILCSANSYKRHVYKEWKPEREEIYLWRSLNGTKHRIST